MKTAKGGAPLVYGGVEKNRKGWATRLGRKTSTVYPDQTTDTTHYDSLGRVDYKLDQAGVRTDYGYDGDGRLTSVTQYLNFGQANQQALVTQYGYDEVGNRISQTDANQHTTKYVYDQLGRRISRMLPAGQSESYSYDAVGNLQQKIDFNGKTTAYAYDSNNRLQSKTPDPSFSAPAVGFTYSATGKRLTMSDVSGAVQSEYRGPHVLGAFGGFVEPELYGIGVDFTPQFAEGKDHWSCFVTEETAKPDDDRFAAAAKRIKNQGGNFLPRPNLGQQHLCRRRDGFCSLLRGSCWPS